MVPFTDGCPNPVNPACWAESVSTAVSGAASDYVLGGLGRAFAGAAQQLAQLAMSALDDSTAIDLSATWFRANVAVIAAVTLPAIVGLFVIQIIGSVLRREPGGLGRAVVGVGKALLGSALALAATQLALTAVDGICAYIASSANTTVGAAAARFFDFTFLATQLNPGLQLVIATLLIVGFLILWGVLIFRKASLLLIAVFAPVAFAGSVWDATRVWTRRWLEVVAALVLSKVVIVVVFVIGASAFSGVGSDRRRDRRRLGFGSEPVRRARRRAAAAHRDVRTVADLALRALGRHGGRGRHALHGRREPGEQRGTLDRANRRHGRPAGRCVRGARRDDRRLGRRARRRGDGRALERGPPGGPRPRPARRW